MYCKHTHTHTQAQTHTKKHISFTQSVDMHTLVEHSFEPAAEIQVAPDHFYHVFCFHLLVLYLSLLFQGVIYTAAFSLPLTSLSSLPSLSLCSHCVMCLEPTEVFEMLTCIL